MLPLNIHPPAVPRGPRGALRGATTEELSISPTSRPDGARQEWVLSFLMTNRERRRLIEQRRIRMFGRAWRQLDVRYYLLRRARAAPAFTALAADAPAQLRAAAAGGAANENAPAPRPGLPRQRGGGAFDDSLPKPQTLFKLPLSWRYRVIGERVVALRAAMPQLPPRTAAELYTGAPALLCCTSAEVARRLRALALVLRCSYQDAAALVGAGVDCGSQCLLVCGEGSARHMMPGVQAWVGAPPTSNSKALS